MDKEGVEEFWKRRRRTLGEEEDEACRWRRMSATHKEYKSAGCHSEHGTVC